MKPTTIIPILFAILLPISVHAASFVVWPGQSLQAAINSAAPGDNITVQTGTYNENITITKGLDIRGTGGAVLVTGTLTVNNAALPVYVADISFGKSGASGITFTGPGTQNVRMDRCKLVGGGNLASTGTIAYFYKHQFDASVTFTTSTWTFQRCTVAGALQSTDSTAKCIASTVTGGFNHSGTTAGEVTIFQSNLRESTDITLPTGKQGWIAYSTLRYSNFSGGSVEIVGNYFDGREVNTEFIEVRGKCNAFIRNNIMWNDGDDGTAILLVDSGLVKVFNNSIDDMRRGIYVGGSPTGVEIRGNIYRMRHEFRNPVNSYFVRADYSGTIIANNHRFTLSGGGYNDQGIHGGVQSDNTYGDPKWVQGPTDQIYWLDTTSPCINNGPLDALFNDIDGSRNNQGAYGGHSYDPTGRTTLKPVVLSGDVNPLYVKRGGAVTIKARAAVSAAP